VATVGGPTPTRGDGNEPHRRARDAFVASLGFTPDPYQLEALDALDAGRSVLVAAPTGSGKTVVAEYAVARALLDGKKAFYTTPLKALSNQKYGDLVALHGADRVGLLTGDNSINGEAPVVVMTTEVLRNMIYAQSSTLEGLRYVVLDEVHYLQNPYRGAVWEEVIIHTQPDVDLVCLSATVSNAEEFADWIETVRGATAAVIEERRPVELRNLYLVGDRHSERLHLLPTFVDGRPNQEAAALDSRAARHAHRGPVRGRPRSTTYTPRRTEVVERLQEEAMLPAIVFVFSRAGCDEAVRQCLRDGVRLTTPEERKRIRAIAEAKVESLTDEDLRVLGYGEWLSGLEAGLAAHHAGLVPPFKEAVEACFAAALVKVVFATETLSLGINMPARSVVIEKLTKFTGERHEFLTPGEYTQLTGRAGRRGIDDVGYAIVLWSPFVPFDQVAGLASTRTYALTSSFRPTYNMAANLVHRYRPDQAHHLLNLSFAQYRADADVVRLEAQLERVTQLLAAARARAACERGDVEEYLELERHAKGAARAGIRTGWSRDQVHQALERLKPGDVLSLPGSVAGGRLAVVSTSRRRGGEVRVGGVSVDTRKVTLSERDFAEPPRPVGRIELPAPYEPSSQRFLRDAAAALRSAQLPSQGADGDAGEGAGSTALAGGPASSAARRRARESGSQPDPLSAHPVASCPDLRDHLRAAARVERLSGDARRLETRIRGRSESLARQFDRVLRVLEAWGYVEGWRLTGAGERLARVYHECDLLVAESMEAGLLDGLDPASVAALVSVFTYESRGPGPAVTPWFPSHRVRERWLEIERLSHQLNGAEEEGGLPATRPPDPGFVAAAYAWAAGENLGEVMAEEEISGGDFVRNVKQLLDLLRQLADVAHDPATAAAARTAADRLFRGVVAASSVVGGAVP
jgi:ATP-dependent RNA helicase HelY